MSAAFSAPWGASSRCVMVAEIGNNHQGSLDTARRCIDAAAASGADAVKFQKRHLPTLFTRQALEKPYTGRHSFGATYGEHREKLELSVADMAALKLHAEKCGVVFSVSVWDTQSLEEMLSIGVTVLKLPSADLTNLTLLRRCAETGLPLVLSSGMSTLAEIDAAVSAVREFHNNILLLHCNSTYPCPPDAIGLPVMHFLAERHNLPVGYSGHEEGLGPSVAAAALGARMIERHFTLDKTQPGSDQACSLCPAEFGQLCRMVRETEAALLVQDKTLYPEEAAMAGKLRKSLVATRDLPAGHVLAPADLAFKCTDKPCSGMREADSALLLGLPLANAVRSGEPFSPESVLPVKDGGPCTS